MGQSRLPVHTQTLEAWCATHWSRQCVELLWSVPGHPKKLPVKLLRDFDGLKLELHFVSNLNHVEIQIRESSKSRLICAFETLFHIPQLNSACSKTSEAHGK
jgi:hypothetical protein